MENVVLWGCGCIGEKAYEELKDDYNVIAYGDSDIYKHNLIFKGIPIISLNELLENYMDCEVIISIVNYFEIAQTLLQNNVRVIGYYDDIQKKVLPCKKINWKDIKQKNKIHLYAGDIYEDFDHYPDDYVICLSLEKSNYRTIHHDITIPYPIEDNTIDCYQMEDVLEHIEKSKAIGILNEIYRILKKGGYLRLSLPDYHSPLKLYNSFLDKDKNVVYDPNGGGKYVQGKVCGGGHLWFPTYESVRVLLEQSDFSDFKFYRYYDNYGNKYFREIDFKKGYIRRTAENSSDKSDNSIVVDCFKL